MGGKEGGRKCEKERRERGRKRERGKEVRCRGLRRILDVVRGPDKMEMVRG